MTADDEPRPVSSGLPSAWQGGEDINGKVRVFLPDRYEGPPVVEFDESTTPYVQASGTVTITPPPSRYGRYVETDEPGGWTTWTWVPF